MAGLETGGPQGPSEALEEGSVCVHVCVCRGSGAVSSGCTQTVCVFDVDLIQLLESQTQSVHPDVDRCAEYYPTSSETHTYAGGIVTHILPVLPLGTVFLACMRR